MTKNRVSDWTWLLKEQVTSQEVLLEYHLKLESLISLLLAKDLVDYPAVRLHHNLWILHDLMNKAKELNEVLLSRLLQFLPK